MKEKRLVTFGQVHRHVINGIVFDKDCVAIVDGNRATVFKLFGQKFAFEYTFEEWDHESTKYYPRGFINVNKGNITMKNSLPNGTTSLVSKWRKDDYYTLIKPNGETIITGSGKAGLQRAVEYAAKNPEAYSHIRNEFDNTFRVLELDGTVSHNSPVYSH